MDAEMDEHDRKTYASAAYVVGGGLKMTPTDFLYCSSVAQAACARHRQTPLSRMLCERMAAWAYVEWRVTVNQQSQNREVLTL